MLDEQFQGFLTKPLLIGSYVSVETKCSFHSVDSVCSYSDWQTH